MASSLHFVLKKQLEKNSIDMDTLPDNVKNFIEKVNSTYIDQDLARYRLSNSLKISSEEMTRLYEELKNQNQRQMLESKLSTLGEMAAGLAHEINNPLAILDMSIQLLPEYENEQQSIKPIYDDLTITIERIKKIVASLKTYSRNVENDPLIECNLKEIIDDTLLLFAYKVKKQKIKISNNIPSDIKIKCRPSQISQIILNLINNSSDAMESIEDKWIKFKYENLDDYSILKVIDNGPIISQEVKNKLMKPFFTTKELGKGTGLGLNISKKIMSENLGDFYFDDFSELHTCFVLKFKTN